AQLFSDPAGGIIGINLRPLRHSSSGGFEEFHDPTRSNFLPDANGVITQIFTLSPGRYGIEIDASTPADPFGGTPEGGTDYHLNIAYDVDDPQGNTFATARNVGTIDQFGKSFTGYLS